MNSHDTKILERRRAVVQSRLLRTVDELDARAHRVQDDVKNVGATAKEVVETVKRHALPTVAATAAVLALFGLSAWAFGVAIERRRPRTLTDRLRDKVRELDLVPRPSFLRRAAEKAGLALVSVAASEVGRRVIHEVTEGHLQLPGFRPVLQLPEHTT